MEFHRKIIHLDLDAFFCAVEENWDKTLVGKPFAVGGRPENRGVVASCSYAARQYKINSAMPMSNALRLCPQLIIIPHHFNLYRQASKEVMERLRERTSLVEQISIDEAFLDVSSNSENVEMIGKALQTEILRELNLPSSLGIATNKLVAKIATDVGKSRVTGEGPPNAITVVEPGKEADFLAPLPVRSLWGVGPRTKDKLALMDVYTIGQLAKVSLPILSSVFGKHGEEMFYRSRGIDRRPVVVSRPVKSISQEITFDQDISNPEILLKTLEKQAESIHIQLSKKNIGASTVRLKVRWSDFQTVTRQTSFQEAINGREELYNAGILLLRKIWVKDRPIRLIGLGVSGLQSGPRQLSLWEPAG